MAQTRFSKAKDLVEVIKNVVEVLALAIGGWWAYHTFGLKDAPTLQAKVDLGVEFAWSRIGDRCLASALIELQNTSASALSIASADADAYLVPVSALPSGELSSVDWNAIIANGPGVSKLPKLPGAELAILQGQYPPSAKSSETLQWLISPRADKIEEWLYVTVKVREAGENGQAGKQSVNSKDASKQPPSKEWVAGRWDRACGESKDSNESETAKVTKPGKG